MATDFQTEYTFLQSITGDTSAASLVYFKQIVNTAYRALALESEWPWLKHSFHLNLEGIYNTGTVTVTKGSTAGTSSGATFDTSWADREISLPSGAVYLLAGTTPFPSTSTFTLATAAAATETAVAYTMFRRRYTLPARMRSIHSMWPGKQPRANILPISGDEMSTLISSAYVFRDPPSWWTPVDSDSSDVFRVEFYPVPNSDQPVRVSGLRYPVDLSGATDALLCNDEFYDALRQKELELLFQFRREYDRAQTHRTNYLKAVDTLKKRGQLPDAARSDALLLDEGTFGVTGDPRDGLPRYGRIY